MARLIIAIALGLVVGVGGVALAQNLLSTQADGHSTSQSLYQYGSH
jgi:hypothetical protein